ncbi:MAG: phosphatase PAP2 family protein [Deltaproteobacteria bacterium]|nr:phosphatase PAP2 family protein [Deltaproteobacteria bacterium]
MDYLAQLDRGIFSLLNTRLTTSFLDFFMPFITTKANFIGVIIFAWVIIFIAGKWKERKMLILVVVAVLTSDLIADTLKHLIHRVRPCNALTDVRILVGCTKSFSFPSGHATNVFASAVYLSYIYRRYAIVFFSMAVLVAYSRIYVGVHYPLDVMGGALVGSMGAILIIETDKRLTPLVVSWVKKYRQRNFERDKEAT